MKTIYTKRYKLRKVELNDVDNIFKILSDMETVKYLNLPNIDSKETVRDIVIDYLKEFEKGNKYPFAICTKDSNEFVGIFLIKLDLYDDDCFEFTIYINKKYWNIGIYSEILPFMMEYAFNEIKTNNFRGFIMKSNKASAKVLLKNNFILEKEFTVEGLPDTIESYLMTKKDYNKIRF